VRASSPPLMAASALAATSNAIALIGVIEGRPGQKVVRSGKSKSQPTKEQPAKAATTRASHPWTCTIALRGHSAVLGDVGTVLTDMGSPRVQLLQRSRCVQWSHSPLSLRYFQIANLTILNGTQGTGNGHLCSTISASPIEASASRLSAPRRLMCERDDKSDGAATLSKPNAQAL
jgi:hypothetical protein